MNRHLEAVPTLPKLLAGKGYLSLQTGKWWQGDFRRGGFTHGMTQRRTAWRRGAQDRPQDHAADLRLHSDGSPGESKPFFVWYAPMMPHDPHTPPERLLAKYTTKTPSLHVARYWAMVEWFDETCGELLDYLDQNGLAENTLVVYVTDNGWIQNPAGRGPVRSKTTPYDAGLRTPIMIRWPGKIAPRDSEELAMSIDLAPTILHAVGLQPSAAMQGINLLDEQAVRQRKTIFGACFTHNAVDLNDPTQNLLWRWTIDGHWKLIVPAPGAKNAGRELYDILTDPFEKTNLAADQGQTVEALQRELDKWWQP